MKTDVCALTLCLGLAACGGTPLAGFAASLPKERIADYRVFAQNCQKCHALDRALEAHVTDPNHWDLYVARMMRTPSSGIHPSEGPKIVRFLHFHTEQRNQGRGDDKP